MVDGWILGRCPERICDLRLGEEFLNNRGRCLSLHGFVSDAGKLERDEEGFCFYHFTREDRLEKVLAEGLSAHRTIGYLPAGQTIAEGFLVPLPIWLQGSPYFGDLGFELFEKYVGKVLLRIRLPLDIENVYIADYAHMLEVKHETRRGSAPLGLGYDASSGKECNLAYYYSYVKLMEYKDSYLCPVAQFIREGSGVVIPSGCIEVCECQPFVEGCG